MANVLTIPVDDIPANYRVHGDKAVQQLVKANEASRREVEALKADRAAEQAAMRMAAQNNGGGERTPDSALLDEDTVALLADDPDRAVEIINQRHAAALASVTARTDELAQRQESQALNAKYQAAVQEFSAKNPSLSPTLVAGAINTLQQTTGYSALSPQDQLERAGELARQEQERLMSADDGGDPGQPAGSSATGERVVEPGGLGLHDPGGEEVVKEAAAQRDDAFKAYNPEGVEMARPDPEKDGGDTGGE